MKLVLILFMLTVGGQGNSHQGDSISNPTWLEDEWNKSQIEFIMEDVSCAKVFIVNMEGELVLTLDEVAINNKMIAPREYRMYKTSDFLFRTSDGDKYYLKD